jgi:hypothetical protein
MLFYFLLCSDGGKKMIDFSIKTFTAPFVPMTNRCFDKITKYIVMKHPGVPTLVVNHDLKVLMFNAATSLLVSTIAIAYFKMMALITAVASVFLFYLARQIIAETIVPIELLKESSESSSLLQNIAKQTHVLIPAIANKAKKKSTKEKMKEAFYRGDDILIGSVVLLKLTHYPLPKMMGMIFTRS